MLWGMSDPTSAPAPIADLTGVPFLERSLATFPDGVVRCAWPVERDSRYLAYHDEEWGRPNRDGRHLFEMLVLEGAQAGLSWSTILNKRDGYRRAFAGFDPVVVASFGPADVERLLGDAGIVRNRLKIESAITSARAVTELGGSEVFAALLWSFVDGRPRDDRPARFSQVAPETPESKAMSRDLKRRGFRFVGPTVCYALMQACGMVNDHIVGCMQGEAIRAATSGTGR
jgi:DNA-3-methyladenine glycosylase I